MSIPQSSDAPVQIRTIGKRWFWIDNAVYDHYASQLGLAGLGLYVALARYANNKTAQCWPSLTRLATEMGTEVEVLEDALERLVTAGLVHMSQHPGKGTVLTLLAPTLAAAAPTPVAVAPVISRAREDEKEQNPEQERTKTFVSLSSAQKQDKEQTHAREGDGLPPGTQALHDMVTLNPLALAPADVPEALRHAQCEDNLSGLAMLRATLWPAEAAHDQRVSATTTEKGQPHVSHP